MRTTCAGALDRRLEHAGHRSRRVETRAVLEHLYGCGKGRHRDGLRGRGLRERQGGDSDGSKHGGEHSQRRVVSPRRRTRLPQLLRRLGTRDAALIVMGGIVGSGIFMNPSVVARYAPAPAAIMLIWTAGGAVALARRRNLRRTGGPAASRRRSLCVPARCISSRTRIRVRMDAAAGVAERRHGRRGGNVLHVLRTVDRASRLDQGARRARHRAVYGRQRARRSRPARPPKTRSWC